jgi:uncharacterized repeat protein (TIGR01451 family)
MDQGLFILRPTFIGAALQIDKSGPAGPVQPGDEINYTITVTNTGVETATQLIVTDILNGNPVQLAGPDELAPGESAEFLFDYIVQEADCAAGILTNTAEAVAENAPTVVSDPVQTTLDGCAVELSITKGQPDGLAEPGQTITYTITVSNSGNVTATGVVVTDTLNGLAVVVPGPDTIAPDSSADYFFSYLIQEADCEAGLSNLAEVTSDLGGSAFIGPPVVTPVSCGHVQLLPLIRR